MNKKLLHFEKKTYIEPHEGIYIVDGDTPISNKKKLEEFYYKLVELKQNKHHSEHDFPSPSQLVMNQYENGNKEMNLFLGIKNGEFSDDFEASRGIYGSEEVDFKFRMLKSRLNRKLLNHLFFMDFEMLLQQL